MPIPDPPRVPEPPLGECSLDFDRVLGVLRSKEVKPMIANLVRSFTRAGFDRNDIAAVFTFLGQGLADERLGTSIEIHEAFAKGVQERRRGAFEEFYGGAAPERSNRRYD